MERTGNSRRTFQLVSHLFLLRVCFVPCDVTKKEEFVNLFDKTEEFFQVACVDLLANNAGINLNHGWRMCMEVNIMSVMLGTEIALERMRAAGKSGQIINTASMAGIGPGLSEKMLAYTVSKHGVVALTRTLGATTKVENTPHRDNSSSHAQIREQGRHRALSKCDCKCSFYVLTCSY